jgi:hypothetical protein
MMVFFFFFLNEIASAELLAHGWLLTGST